MKRGDLLRIVKSVRVLLLSLLLALLLLQAFLLFSSPDSDICGWSLKKATVVKMWCHTLTHVFNALYPRNDCSSAYLNAIRCRFGWTWISFSESCSQLQKSGIFSSFFSAIWWIAAGWLCQDRFPFFFLLHTVSFQCESIENIYIHIHLHTSICVTACAPMKLGGKNIPCSKFGMRSCIPFTHTHTHTWEAICAFAYCTIIRWTYL